MIKDTSTKDKTGSADTCIPGTKPHPLKLNIFHRGGLQLAVMAVAYLASIVAGAYIFARVDAWIFIMSLREAERKGVIAPDVFANLQAIIMQRNIATVLLTIALGGFCVLIGWLLMRRAAKLNWSWPVTLPRAVEFRAAMEQLGIVDPEERIYYTRKYKLPVFIASTPITGKEQASVRARLYAFAHNPVLSTMDIFIRHAGKQTLCLNADDFERVLRNAKQRFSLEESVAVEEREKDIKGLRTALASEVQKSDALLKERNELRGKVRIQQAQENGRIERLRVEHLLWAAYIPVMERLLREAPDGKQYTTPEIESAFAVEWGRRKDLRERMKTLTGSDKAAPSANFMNAVKAEFKAQGKLHLGGRPKKTPEVSR
jgi:hypothetical protein